MLFTRLLAKKPIIYYWSLFRKLFRSVNIILITSIMEFCKILNIVAAITIPAVTGVKKHHKNSVKKQKERCHT